MTSQSHLILILILILAFSEEMSEENHHKLWRELKELRMSHLDGEENSFTSTDGLISHSGRRWKDSVDESRFRDELLKGPHKTSSRLTLLRTDTSASPSSTFNKDEPPVCSFRQQRMRDVYPSFTPDPGRLLGEIAFQLDRRILSHVFQEQSRLYGFTVQNIPDKIQQVCVHPLSGTVDELYRIRLLERHSEVIDGLYALGYNTSLHPAFSELIVNTYGILKEDPAYSDPAVLRRVVVETAPSRLMKDLLLLLDCLCFMARRDGRPLFLW